MKSEIPVVALKELRQLVRSRFVAGVMIGWLVISFLCTICLLIGSGFMVTPESVKTLVLGQDLFSAQAIMLYVALALGVPSYVGVRIALERRRGATALQFATLLRPSQFADGKIFAALVLILMFVAASIPYCAFAFLMRGISITGMAIVIAGIAGMSIFFSYVFMALGSLPIPKPFFIILSVFLGGSMLIFGGCWLVVLMDDIPGLPYVVLACWDDVLLGFLFVVTCCWLLRALTSAMLAPYVVAVRHGRPVLRRSVAIASIFWLLLSGFWAPYFTAASPLCAYLFFAPLLLGLLMLYEASTREGHGIFLATILAAISAIGVILFRRLPCPYYAHGLVIVYCCIWGYILYARFIWRLFFSRMLNPAYVAVFAFVIFVLVSLLPFLIPYTWDSNELRKALRFPGNIFAAATFFKCDASKCYQVFHSKIVDVAETRSLIFFGISALCSLILPITRLFKRSSAALLLVAFVALIPAANSVAGEKVLLNQDHEAEGVSLNESIYKIKFDDGMKVEVKAAWSEFTFLGYSYDRKMVVLHWTIENPSDVERTVRVILPYRWDSRDRGITRDCVVPASGSGVYLMPLFDWDNSEIPRAQQLDTKEIAIAENPRVVPDPDEFVFSNHPVSWVSVNHADYRYSKEWNEYREKIRDKCREYAATFFGGKSAHGTLFLLFAFATVMCIVIARERMRILWILPLAAFFYLACTIGVIIKKEGASAAIKEYEFFESGKTHRARAIYSPLGMIKPVRIPADEQMIYIGNAEWTAGFWRQSIPIHISANGDTELAPAWFPARNPTVIITLAASGAADFSAAEAPSETAADASQAADFSAVDTVEDVAADASQAAEISAPETNE